ncbi:Very-long-chain 3-oxoacyl-CoA reductase 1 [Vitis vinifera]|uniref:Very-long-chain 3-oxoacyl-CoA reductase 1 n=1 Tax=Vitis vinifera TaxID=29760 RepID=A0A438GQ25_VITVI|nr:Very-long-chain 3-oxoacyl-CoA reductase 1 [Vitis vinifera]
MELPDFVLMAASIVGFIALCKPLVGLVKWVWAMFSRPPKNLKEYGSWALVTGSTDGIGKAMAFELASKGLSLVLVGQNPSKLKAVSNKIRERHGEQVEVKSIVIDFAKFSGEEIAAFIKEGIEGIDVGVLINNVGLSYPYARFFHEVDLELMGSVMRVNIEGATWVTRSVLPRMLEKKKGAIINICSGSVLLPSYPLVTLYVAAKAYIAMLSKSLNLEYQQYGIAVQCQRHSARQAYGGLDMSMYVCPIGHIVCSGAFYVYYRMHYGIGVSCDTFLGCEREDWRMPTRKMG